MTAESVTVPDRIEPVTIPLYFPGETLNVLLMADSGTRAVSAVVAAVANYGGIPHITLAITDEAAMFALAPVPVPPLDPIHEPCDGCNADPGEPCRWGCLARTDDNAETEDRSTC